MINEQYKSMLQGKSVIRQLSEFATERGKEIGYENVFDYSLGNPSVPVPVEFNEGLKRMIDEKSSMELHGYSPSVGIAQVKDAIADSLNKRFDMNYKGIHIFPTSGAAGAIAHAVRCVTKAGDEVLTFAPYFPEYIPYINTSGACLKVVPANTKDFQINFEEFDKMMNENVAAVLINTPNNPSGVVYNEDTLTKLSSYLYKKQEEYGHDIFIISDEPYREIVFDGIKAPYVSKFYDNTLSCYSYSKSLSLPGERIGYVAVNPKCTDADLISAICAQISRGIGHNCPSSMMQYGVANVLDMTSDMNIYETNMNLIYDELVALGFEVVRPGGTFYIFPKALEEDAVAFCNKAKEYDLILVPSDSFGVKGYFRMAYCIDTDKVKRSLVKLRQFVKECY